MSEEIEQLTESMENYLEVILELEKTNKVARAKDIADKLQIQRGSVTGAGTYLPPPLPLPSLSGGGCAIFDQYLSKSKLGELSAS